ncbi:MAG TPA: amylo-alpha-1,6-glucosidase [Saprospiraceae bacterium]|nr:amylo-alpha-1,6-glucosidase [Saprospiraceae bacterium]
MFTFDQPDFHELSTKEWLVTNGIGGFASSTISGANTSRYHGLLVAAFNPPTDRRVLVSKIEEHIEFDGESLSLSSNVYPGVIHPQGFHWITSFEEYPFPTTIFQKDKIRITKTVFMRHGSNTTVVEYQNTGDQKFTLQLNPLLVHRDYHHLFQELPIWEFKTEVQEKTIEVIAKNGSPPLWIHFTKGKFQSQPDWYRNFQYEKEKERGLDYSEDAKSIGLISCQLPLGDKISIILSTDQNAMTGNPGAWKKQEAKRLENITIDSALPFVRDLYKSGNQFIVHRNSTEGNTIIAGYPWFTDWGRDTMIAMRGLVIAGGRKKMAESIFETFLSNLDCGMIPNRFPDRGAHPEYNNIDGTLWLFVALHGYVQKFRDVGFIKKIFPKLSEILTFHFEGTRFNIHVTKDGLLYGGEPGTQLTWMDAKVDGHVVTPRIGCAVEVNALWYNAISIYVELGEQIGHDVSNIKRHIKRTEKAFRKHFIHKKGHLYDVVGADGKKDDAIRPNQVYAISLPFSPLSLKESRKVMEVVTKHLYTPFGLRSLSPRHSDFKAVYTGDPWSRDHAYHQGTVWSHLWGEFALAYLRVHKNSADAKFFVRVQAGTLEEHFYRRDGIRCISEIFDGAKPNTGKGCIQQAWSIGNTLLALLRTE